ncbi:MAG: ATP-binding protein [Bacteroidales bacterium]|nr:ATP-binding protein [Bacteroidales bacterium]
MLKLVKVKINKYKSFQQEQEVKIEDRVTTLVGKNESGKTAFLEALAKVNYFEKDKNFKLNPVSDYPRNELVTFRNSKKDMEALRCTFDISRQMMQDIEDDVGKGVFPTRRFSCGISYKGKTTWFDLKANEKKFIDHFLNQYDIPDSLREKLSEIKTITDLLEYRKHNRQDELLAKLVSDLESTYVKKGYKWKNKIKGYIAKHHLKKNMPGFWYFDEYYLLPSRINISALKRSNPEDESLKISRAFFELAGINVDELLETDDFESYVADLEATSNAVTEEIFKYWTTDRDLEIKFDIEHHEQTGDKILDIRIRNTNRKVSLPLRNRSRGLNMFFSFIVWFSKIQHQGKRNFILLLDEPGLNLHASAQADLLKFIEDLSKEYQVIYTTHSPFMIDPSHMGRVRTLVDSKDGSNISELLREDDPDTLFPLQAAIGFNLAQSIFRYKRNLLVENPSDLIYLTVLSNILKAKRRTGLKETIKIIPIGGLDKLVTFISLVRSDKLSLVCLMHSFRSDESKQKAEELTREKMINSRNIRFYDEFTANMELASIEDLFEKEEYIRLYNAAYETRTDIRLKDLDSAKPNILDQLDSLTGKRDFDPYQVASKLALLSVDATFFSSKTLARFEKLFKEINKLL